MWYRVPQRGATALRNLTQALGLLGENFVAEDIDENFYSRADAVIHLANDQLRDMSRGKVSASCMYATARFNAWVSACRHGSGEDMAAAKEETLEYFVKQYRAMLEENLDDYIHNFSKYIRPSEA